MTAANAPKNSAPQKRPPRKKSKPPPRYVTPGEFAAIFEPHADQMYDSAHAGRLRRWLQTWRRDYMLFYIAFTTGLRNSEVRTLKVKQFTEKDQDPKKEDSPKIAVITVKGKGGKVRTTSLSPDAWSLVKKYIKMNNLRREDYLFPGRNGGPISRSRVEHAFKKYVAEYAKRNGIEYFTCNAHWSKITVHSLRHGYAVAVLNRGLPITVLQKVLGHADIKETQRYAEMTSEEAAKKAASIDLFAEG